MRSIFGDGIKKAQQRPAFCLDVVGLRFFRQPGLTACWIVRVPYCDVGIATSVASLPPRNDMLLTVRSLDLDALADLLHPDGSAILDGHQQLAVLQLPQVLENLPLLIADLMESQLFFFAHVFSPFAKNKHPCGICRTSAKDNQLPVMAETYMRSTAYLTQPFQMASQ